MLKGDDGYYSCQRCKGKTFATPQQFTFHLSMWFGLNHFTVTPFVNVLMSAGKSHSGRHLSNTCTKISLLLSKPLYRDYSKVNI